MYLRPRFIGLLVLYVLLTGLYLRHTSSLQKIPIITKNVTVSPKSGPSPPKPLKYILYWTNKWSSKKFAYATGSSSFKKCPVKNCFTTNDRKLKPVEEFDAILFHGPANKQFDKEPKKRSSKQVYVFANEESPEFFLRTWRNVSWFESTKENFYNWTMTYRTDSDIVDKYGYVRRSKTNYKPPTVEEIRKRPKKVAWLVSHCTTAAKREVLFDKLSKYIESEKFGRCGKLKCFGSMSGKCYDYLEKNFYFYLSFENVICKEYVTEKLYYILRKNLVPVVYGGADYTVDAPPNSFINVFDFPTVEHLADYLNYLIENPEKYLEYFKWKRDYRIIMNHTGMAFCDLCAKLNAPREEKMYPNIKQWFADGQCDENVRDIINT